ncbi:TetR/AcrR family transcriptional regulator [Nonomuraea terrae]|uniref:TetR/AcrR family transcriptional regulator n=1 Tax=Nonomuraea terrae TaxID=2530383 RepID=A0A4R4Y8R2_9ACTN|nr:TetR/AcrR family transcriptional regulator [Nonomuraea terrae]TDD40815.1 TetR/AcrR family transcriptional regulator [Nonomuraea terrae]
MTSAPDATPPAEPARRRRRDPDTHRAAILEAAREAFAERGYARATIRDIARRAGVTHGLVMRHFTSKERLFLCAVPGTRDIDEVVAGDLASLPERVAGAFVARMETNAADDPFVALVRSAASDERAAIDLYTAMQRRSVAAYRTVLDGDDVDVRVDLMAAQLTGVAFNRYIVRAGPLASMTAAELTTHLSRVLRRIMFD